jgi:uncharacterized protein
VIAVDTNILVYAHRRDSEWHRAASSVVRELAESPNPWSIPAPCLHEFLAIVTHPRVYAPPSSLAQAFAQLEEWLASPSLLVIRENSEHWRTLRALASEARAAGAAIHDARIAALCASHAVSALYSADRDFGRYPSIRCVNPLIER